MKKYWSLLLLIPFLIFSCVEDESEYSIQKKEDVNVENNFNVDTTNTDEVLPEGQLVPGLHTVTLQVQQGDELVDRQFKYFMPVSMDVSKPISLIFEFHGSIEFKTGVKPSNPIAGITETHAWNQHAVKENCIICFPAGVAEFQADSSGAVNWAGDNYEKSLPFVDAMVKYFTEDNEPSVDPKRIYSTGQSSGAIFSFVLALHRSEVFAAITPRAGQSASTEPFPSRAVPVRVFAGEKDNTVQHESVITNVTKWANEIGGYFDSDMQMDTTSIEDYADVTIRYWHGGKADYEIYSLAGITHGISVTDCVPAMWEFMKNHTLDNATTPLYVTTDIKELEAQCGESFEIQVSYTDGAEIAVDAPQSWNPQFDGKILKLTAPLDYFGNIERDGTITFTVTSGNQNPVSCEIPYHLVAPKSYFEVGDIYYNDAFEPVGIVCWVNNSNIKEAKIIELTGVGNYGTIWYCGSGNGLGLGFDTPDMADGEGNTAKMMEYNNTLATPFTASDAAFAWAGTYEYKGVDGWYLPAAKELEAIAPSIDKINEAIEAIGGKIISTNFGDLVLYSSTTEVKSGADTKSIYSYNYSKKQIVENKAKTAGQEYFGFISARAFKKVTKN